MGSRTLAISNICNLCISFCRASQLFTKTHKRLFIAGDGLGFPFAGKKKKQNVKRKKKNCEEQIWSALGG